MLYARGCYFATTILAILYFVDYYIILAACCVWQAFLERPRSVPALVCWCGVPIEGL
jgi:hypothetical protein